MAERNRVVKVDVLDWRVVGTGWPRAEAARVAVEAHWAARLAQAPQMFNGRVFIMVHHRLAAGRLEARFHATDFASFLAWREGVFSDDSVLDGFSSTLLRTADGGILLGRQTAGHINAGLAYPPAGFIDAADVLPDGRIDLEASVRRELLEEVGVGPEAYRRTPGYYVTFCGAIVAACVPLVTTLERAALLAHAGAFIAQETAPELDSALIVGTLDEVAGLAMPAHARLLVESILAGRVEAV